VVLLAACAKEERSQAPKPLSEAGEVVYVLKGRIVGRDAADNTLRVDHEAIAGYMDAMTMDYPVRGATVDALPPDQTRVEARLHVHGDRNWITDVKKVS
jgi:protein SCO1/2